MFLLFEQELRSERQLVSTHQRLNLTRKGLNTLALSCA